LELFAEVLRRVAGGATNPPAALAGETAPAPAPTPAALAATLIEQTNAEVEVETAAQRALQKAAREALRAQQGQHAGADEDVPWPTHLPMREEKLPVPESDRFCPDCKQERTVIRYEMSWRIEYKTTAEVVVTYSPVVACASHHGGPHAPEVPPKPVDRGQMGFSLAARCLWLRTTHNLPVRRIAEMMQAEGVPLTEEMVHTLICVSGERVKPLDEAIHQAVQAATLVNMDDTPVEIIDGDKERKSRKARVWLALGDERFAWFFATRTWKESEAEQALGTIKGTLQGDGYKGFPKYTRRQDVKLAGCMGHLRRKFHKALLARDPRATEPMALIQGLYRVEELGRLRDLDAKALLALRQERSVPIWQAILAWAQTVAPTIESGSTLGQAWTYLRNQRAPLETFLSDGHVAIDNSAAERGLRRITIGRKLWLFFRDQDKLDHVARLMSVVSTARLHGVDELAYLTWVLEQVARRTWSAQAATKLLPGAWAAMQEKPVQERAPG
jgi:transposase